jgi:hypothetical protein
MLRARAAAAAARWERASRTALANDLNGRATRRTIDGTDVVVVLEEEEEEERGGSAPPPPTLPPPRGKVDIVVATWEVGEGRCFVRPLNEGGQIEEAMAEDWYDMKTIASSK